MGMGGEVWREGGGIPSAPAGWERRMRRWEGVEGICICLGLAAEPGVLVEVVSTRPTWSC